jgi:hypothetical protein
MTSLPILISVGMMNSVVLLTETVVLPIFNCCVRYVEALLLATKSTESEAAEVGYAALLGFCPIQTKAQEVRNATIRIWTPLVVKSSEPRSEQPLPWL